MNLQFVRYFVLLAEIGNFTKAANKACVVQSSFSLGIKKLEQQLNCKLFHRDKRTVSLTEEGKLQLPKAKRLLGVWNEMEDAFSKDIGIPLKMGVVNDIDFSGIVPMVKSFHQLHPSYETQILENSEIALIKALENEEIDCYFHKELPANKANLEFRRIRKDELVFAVPVDHPYASKNKLAIDVIDNEKFIERTNCPLHTELTDIFREHLIKPNVVFRAKGDDVAKALVAAGMGISLVPNIETPYPNLKLIKISGLKLYTGVFLIWKKGNASKALQKFLAL